MRGNSDDAVLLVEEYWGIESESEGLPAWNDKNNVSWC
jgi:hypothetical protein